MGDLLLEEAPGAPSGRVVSVARGAGHALLWTLAAVVWYAAACIVD